MKKINFFIRLILFVGAFILAGVAVLEKVFNLFGYTLLKEYFSPWKLLEFSVIALLFVVALELREIKLSLTAEPAKEDSKNTK